MAVVGAGALCGLDYIGIIYLYWLLLLALGLLPGGVGFLGHAGKQRLQHGQQARRERLSQPTGGRKPPRTANTGQSATRQKYQAFLLLLRCTQSGWGCDRRLGR